jgi:thymidylate synthase (FAD)
MYFCKPKVFVIASPLLDRDGIDEIAKQYKAEKWFNENVLDVNNSTTVSDEELLIEIMARACYKSFGAGLNPNVTKVREGNAEYLQNVINSEHGSVLEHAHVSFMFNDVSRVFTHELVRHRVGVAISQESLRYVRLTELKCFDFPRLEDELTEEEEKWFRQKTIDVFSYLEEVQREMGFKFKLNDEQSFARKKKLTSRMRRLAPIGLLTNIGWTANLRTLRHVIPLRTSKSAEEEIRWVFADVGSICKKRYPHVFFDMEWESDSGNTGLGSWVLRDKRIYKIDKGIIIKENEGIFSVMINDNVLYQAQSKSSAKIMCDVIRQGITEFLNM